MADEPYRAIADGCTPAPAGIARGSHITVRQPPRRLPHCLLKPFTADREYEETRRGR